MIVSEFSPRTTLKFNVHTESARGPGEPWGTWSFVKQGGVASPQIGSSKQLGSAPNSPVSPKVSLMAPLPKTGVEDRQVHYTCKVSNVSASPRSVIWFQRNYQADFLSEMPFSLQSSASLLANQTRPYIPRRKARQNRIVWLGTRRGLTELCI
jgi:hypothetical protein